MRRRGDGRAGGGFAGYRGGGGGGERGALPPSADRLPPPRACRRPPAASLRPSASGWRSLARRVKGCASLRTNADEAGDSRCSVIAHALSRARPPPPPTHSRRSRRPTGGLCRPRALQWGVEPREHARVARAARVAGLIRDSDARQLLHAQSAGAARAPRQRRPRGARDTSGRRRSSFPLAHLTPPASSAPSFSRDPEALGLRGRCFAPRTPALPRARARRRPPHRRGNERASCSCATPPCDIFFPAGASVDSRIASATELSAEPEKRAGQAAPCGDGGAGGEKRTQVAGRRKERSSFTRRRGSCGGPRAKRPGIPTPVWPHERRTEAACDFPN